MISTINTDRNDPLKKFYSKYFCFSYSSLNKLLHSAQSFYNWYILKEREDGLQSYLVEGKVIHCLLLDKDMFNKQFVVMPGKLPGVSNKKLAEDMYKLTKERSNSVNDLSDLKQEIIQWLEDNNLHQKLTDDKDGSKTGDEKRLEKILTEETRDYFSYLQTSENKDVLDPETLARCEEAVALLRQNRRVRELLRLGEEGFELIEIHNEKPLAVALQGFPFGLQGIVDNYVIDHEAKRVDINDLKTTGKSLREFRESIEYYKYWMQAAIYIRMIKAHHPDTADYTFAFHFIVIDKYNQVYPFPVSEESILDWQSQLEEVLQIAKYHYTKKEYSLPYEFATGQVTL